MNVLAAGVLIILAAVMLIVLAAGKAIHNAKEQQNKYRD